MKLNDEQVEALKGLIASLKQDLENEDLPPGRREAIQKRIVDLEVQAEAEDADETVIGECCNYLEGLIDEWAAEAASKGWIQRIGALFGV